LTNVVRASLEELLIDYKDFLRVRKLKYWDKSLPYYPHLTEKHKIPNGCYQIYQKGIESEDPEVLANVMISIINTDFLTSRKFNCRYLFLI
jgi:hypothetical protein